MRPRIYVLFTLVIGLTSADAIARALPEVGTPAGSTRHEFVARDGVRLNYTVFGAGGATTKPIVISPGKGESAFRYEDLVGDLVRRGFGPIYILDHRNQGFSAHTIDNKDSVHVERFEDYVTDLTDFIRGPVRGALGAAGVAHAPYVIAHSMGGAVANLALLKDPTLARKVAYFAPMMDLNTGRFNAMNDRPAYWLSQLLCAAGFCDQLTLGKMRPKTLPLAYTREEAEGIFRVGVTPGWLKAAIRATWDIRKTAKAHAEPSLFIIAKRDRIVGNEAIRAYACAASNCVVQEINGNHGLHENRKTGAQLVDAVATYFDACGTALTSN